VQLNKKKFCVWKSNKKKQCGERRQQQIRRVNCVSNSEWKKSTEPESESEAISVSKALINTFCGLTKNPHFSERVQTLLALYLSSKK